LHEWLNAKDGLDVVEFAGGVDGGFPAVRQGEGAVPTALRRYPIGGVRGMAASESDETGDDARFPVGAPGGRWDTAAADH
jgi:hypothetical protein